MAHAAELGLPDTRFSSFTVVREEDGETTDLEGTAEAFSDLTMRYLSDQEAEVS